MRYFMHVRKTISYVTLQISKAVLKHLRGGRTKGELRLRGTALYSQGSGWYRIYGEVANNGADLLSTINFIASRIKNMDVARLFFPEQKKLFAFEQGLLSSAPLKAKRMLKVVYDKVRGHNAARVINRAHQANDGFLNYLAESLSRLHQATVTENKLVALQAKFAR